MITMTVRAQATGRTAYRAHARLAVFSVTDSGFRLDAVA